MDKEREKASTSIQEAMDIMGDRAISIEGMMRFLGVDFSGEEKEKLERVNFSTEKIQRLKNSAFLYPSISLSLEDFPHRKRGIYRGSGGVEVWFHRAPFFTQEKLETRWYLVNTQLDDIDDATSDVELPWARVIGATSMLYKFGRRHELQGKWPYLCTAIIYCRDTELDGQNISVGPFLNTGLVFQKDGRLSERRKQEERREEKSNLLPGEPEKRSLLDRRTHSERREFDIFTAFSHIPHT